MTGCPACDEWVRDLAARTERPTEPPSRVCPVCGCTVQLLDYRPSDHQEVQGTMSENAEYALDAEGRHGQVMARIRDRVWLRPPSGGVEWDVPAGSVTPCDATGVPLPAPEDVSTTWYARYVNNTITGLESHRSVADLARMPWVSGDLETGVSWTDTDPATRDRQRRFELRPITDQQAANWREHRTLDYEGDPSCTDA